jgi:hypothetical protein
LWKVAEDQGIVRAQTLQLSSMGADV